jgi:hypothetical protein
MLRLPLYHPLDATLLDAEQPDSRKIHYHPGEAEQLERLGYAVETFGNVQFVTGITERQDDGTRKKIADMPHEGRHRSEAERIKAADQEFKSREAGRKRLARRGKRRIA